MVHLHVQGVKWLGVSINNVGLFHILYCVFNQIHLDELKLLRMKTVFNVLSILDCWRHIQHCSPDGVPLARAAHALKIKLDTSVRVIGTVKRAALKGLKSDVVFAFVEEICTRDEIT